MNITTKTRKTPFRLACLGAVLGLLAVGSVEATSITFNGTGTNTDPSSLLPLSAQVIFDDSLGSNQLKVSLTNNNPAKVPSDVLMAVFFDYNGGQFSASLLSATAATVIGPDAASNINLLTAGTKPEWGYANSPSDLGGGVGPLVTQNNGLGTAGFGISPGFGVGGSQQFNYGNISGIAAGANPALSNGNFVLNTAVFVLQATGAFDITKIGNVRFQYGTALNEPSFPGTPGTPGTPGDTTVPEPSSLALLGLGLIASVFALRRRALQDRSLQA